MGCNATMSVGWMMSFGIRDIDTIDYGSGEMESWETTRVSSIEAHREQALEELHNHKPVELLEEMLLAALQHRGLGAFSHATFFSLHS
jgi:hypothetical protein